MNGLDLARFEFDYDNTWQAFFLDAELNVYARYGGRDAESPESRLSKESLLHTMRQVLEAHELRRREPASAAAREAVHPAPEKPIRPDDFPLIRKHHNGCLHCHQVQEYRLLQSYADGAFDTKLLFPFPLPENLGLTFQRDHGHRVERVELESVAEQGGIRPGETILRTGKISIRSEEDFRWSLHRHRGEPELELEVEAVRREGEAPARRKVVLPLAEGWWKGDVSWRKSLRSYPVVWGFLGYSVGSEERRTAGLESDSLAIKVVSLRGQTGGVAQAVGLVKGDLIVGLAGNSRLLTLEQFKSEMLKRYAPGEEIRLEVLRGGERHELRGRFPPWFTTDRTVP
jgi:serine protease Do